MNRALDVAQIHYDKVVYSDIYTLSFTTKSQLSSVFLPKKATLCIYFRENVLFSRKWV